MKQPNSPPPPPLFSLKQCPQKDENKILFKAVWEEE